MAGIDASTVLLLQMNGDRSDSQHPTTYNTGVKLDTTQKKFGYSSAYFGGANFITVPEHYDWDFGSGNYTIDFWVNVSAWTGSYPGLVTYYNSAGTSRSWEISFNGSTQELRFFHLEADATQVSLTYDASGWSIGTWHHIAAVRSGNDLYLFVDGVKEDEDTTSGSIYTITSSSVIMGRQRLSDSRYFNGFIDELRISDTARWSSDFSASLPTIEHSSDANTLYLNHFEGDISDGNHTVTFNGEIEGSATESKWHGSVNYDSLSDYITVPEHIDFDLSNSTWTIDFWFLNLADNNQWITMFGFGTWPVADAVFFNYLFQNGGDTNEWTIFRYDGSTNSDTFTLATADMPLYNWHHIAFVRNGSNYELFINGTTKGTNSASWFDTFFPISKDFHIGHKMESRSSRIDEFRISDVARWTTDFDVPLAPYSRFDYKVSGDIAEDSRITVVNNDMDTLINYKDVTSPTYEITTNDDNPVSVIATPTDTNISSKIYRNVTPIIS